MEQNSPRASDYLPANFLAGLERGDAMQLRREAEMLSPNSVIEGIGNRMLVRDFLVSQKARLSAYDVALRGGQLEDDTRELFRGVDADMAEIHQAAEEYKDTPGGLGVERFRQAFQAQDDAAIIRLAEHVADMKVSEIMAMSSPYDAIRNVRDSIVEVLWGAVQDYREGGDSPGVREEFRRLTAKSVHDIDEKILGSMLR